MNNRTPSKWIGVFKENAQKENESQGAYLRRLAKEYGVGEGTLSSLNTNIPRFLDGAY